MNHKSLSELVFIEGIKKRPEDALKWAKKIIKVLLRKIDCPDCAKEELNKDIIIQILSYKNLCASWQGLRSNYNFIATYKLKL